MEFDVTHLTLIQSTFWRQPTVGGRGHDGPMRGKWPISQPFVVQFSKFFFVVKACENRHLFLFHKQLPIVHRLAARRRQSDEGLSRQFFRAKNPKFSILSYKHDIYLK